MANHKSALKRARQSETRKFRNRLTKIKVRNALKAARAAVAAEGVDSAEAIKNVMSVLGKAASKGVLHPRNAARRIARLSKQAVAKPAAPVA